MAGVGDDSVRCEEKRTYLAAQESSGMPVKFEMYSDEIKFGKDIVMHLRATNTSNKCVKIKVILSGRRLNHNIQHIRLFWSM